jgi:hypothetical protein
VAVAKGLDIDDHPLAHRDSALDRRLAHLRQQHDIVGRLWPEIEGRLVLENIEIGGGHQFQ